MTQYEKVNVMLSNLQLNKLKVCIKNQTGITLRVIRKIFEGDVLYQLLPTAK